MTNAKDEIHVLHFNCVDVLFCIDVQYIKLIILLPQLTKVPNAGKSVIGIMNLAGESIPVIDLAIALHLNKKNHYSVNNPIIICEYENQLLGLLVNDIIGLGQFDKSRAISTNEKKEASYYTSNVLYQNAFSFLLDLKKLFNAIIYSQQGAANA